MPLSRLTCPVCLAVLKPKTPVPEGTQVRCPKCKGAFVAEAEPRAEEPAPAAEPEAVEEPAEDEGVEEVEAAEDDEAEVLARTNDDDEVDRPRKKKARKKGMPVWVWLAGGGVGLLLLCGCCGVPGVYFGWSALGGLSVNQANYDKIKGNMSEAQVKAPLGSPTDVNDQFGLHNENWRSGDYFITVVFRNGKVVDKACRLPLGGGGEIEERGLMMGP